MTYAKREMQRKAAARRAIVARGYWAPHANMIGAREAFRAQLVGLGHAVMCQGYALECLSCGQSAGVNGNEEQGAYLLGGLSELKKCGE
jgi:hypothetical protein